MPEMMMHITINRVDYYCDECFIHGRNEIKLKKKDVILTVDPPLYIYYCSFCEKEFNLTKNYPRVEFII